MQFNDLKKRLRNANKPRLIGISLVLFGFIVLISIYVPIYWRFLSYSLNEDDLVREEEDIVKEIESVEEDEDLPVSITQLFPDKDYSIIIPKIDANSVIVADVDPYDINEYTFALEEGIAEADTSFSPGEDGNTFLFAHSALGFYDLVSNNVNFYLLNRLEENDKIFIIYEGDLYEYAVTSNEVVNPGEIDYLSGESEKEKLTLMTCWPAGTDYKRVIVEADRI